MAGGRFNDLAADAACWNRNNLIITKDAPDALIKEATKSGLQNKPTKGLIEAATNAPTCKGNELPNMIQVIPAKTFLQHLP
ncbi:MAG: hypothetical protein P4M13_06715 [Alphaproteobacteria bacterium]|nr:hypothetical protein [Alphaproteobacteria bacterium]